MDEEVYRHDQEDLPEKVAGNIGPDGVFRACLEWPVQAPGSTSAIYSGRASKPSSDAARKSTRPATATSRSQARNAARGTARYPAGCAAQRANGQRCGSPARRTASHAKG